MKPLYVSIAVIACLSVSLFAAQKTAVRARQEPTRAPSVVETTRPDAVTPEAEPRARIVQYGDNDVVKVKARIRYTTLIVLPKEERILDFTCGDKEFWVVNGTQNLAYIKPAKAGSQTNLNLITASGNIYSFLLAEVSESPMDLPDLKVFVQLRDESILSAASGAPGFVSSETLADCRRQIDLAKDETRRVKESAQNTIDQGIRQFVSNVRFPYRFEAGKKPFGVRAMYTTDKATYIQARPEETPTLYEIKDGKPDLINFEYKDGVYMVGKILDEGYLAIGKKKLIFKRED